MRAADYDDWVTETVAKNGQTMHGLNGDILVWNPVTHRRHELTSMGIRVNPETLKEQLKLTNQLDWLDLPYHRGIVNGDLPLSIGGGIGQARTLMALLKKAHLGEVSVTVWPKILKDMCRQEEHQRPRIDRRSGDSFDADRGLKQRIVHRGGDPNFRVARDVAVPTCLVAAKMGLSPLRRGKGIGPCFRPSVYPQNASIGRKMDQSPTRA